MAMITTEGPWFRDQVGRTLLLRGVNLGGSSKVPRTPDGATWRREGFFDHREVSFVGRPFPLEEADEHFSRLRRWGFTLLRLLVTWEAIEHAGPGIYDEAYLDYVYRLVSRASEYDLQVLIDPHQDVWSRFSGGDGAPRWTFEAVGMDLTRFKATGAALTHQEHGDPFPRMIWPSNYSKFACATMFTLFFAGDHLAPETKVDGLPVQHYLQGHFLDAVKQVALRLSALPNLLGYETLNEPYQGYIGYSDVGRIPARLAARGPSPTIYQGMLLAAGFPQEVAVEGVLPVRLGPAKAVCLNPGGASLWRQGYRPLWQQNGVCDLDRAGRPHLLRPGHFACVGERPVAFGRDYFSPFVERTIGEMRSVHPEALVFVCPPPPELGLGDLDYRLLGHQRLVHAPHWYDGLTLHRQRYVAWLGLDTHRWQMPFVIGGQRKRRSFARQIARLMERSESWYGSAPTLIGETGIAVNLNGGHAYRAGDFSAQIAALDDTMRALEANLVSATLWNYTADNTNARGSDWGAGRGECLRDQHRRARWRRGDPALHPPSRCCCAPAHPGAEGVQARPSGAG